MNSVELVTVGETMVLVTPFAGHDLSPGAHCLLDAAGAESSVAVLLRQLGHHTAWAGSVGSDALGSVVLSRLRSAGVDLSHSTRDANGRTGVMFKFPGPERTHVEYLRRDSAATRMSPDTLKPLGASGARILHLTGITPALSATCRELVFFALREPPGACSTSFDVNYRPTLWEADAPDVLLDCARLADIVFVGLDEAEILWGCDSPSDVRRLIPEPETVIVKNGGDEATAMTGEVQVAVPSLETEKIIDVIGAGDAFAAGWLSGYLKGIGHADRLRLGHYVAQQVIGSPVNTVTLDGPPILPLLRRMWARDSEGSPEAED